MKLRTETVNWFKEMWVAVAVGVAEAALIVMAVPHLFTTGGNWAGSSRSPRWPSFSTSSGSPRFPVAPITKVGGVGPTKQSEEDRRER